MKLIYISHHILFFPPAVPLVSALSLSKEVFHKSNP